MGPGRWGLVDDERHPWVPAINDVTLKEGGDFYSSSSSFSSFSTLVAGPTSPTFLVESLPAQSSTRNPGPPYPPPGPPLYRLGTFSQPGRQDLLRLPPTPTW